MGWCQVDLKRFLEERDGFEATLQLLPSEKHADKVSGEIRILGRFVSVEK